MADPAAIARIQAVFERALSVPAPPSDLDIIAGGLLDSLALVTLLFEMELEFGVEIPLDSLEVEDFRTIERIAALVTAEPEGSRPT
ncbi:MAG TPA: phosphopantetheine-binding protein [Solirubrobacteraceae bacterium]|nr:phosphopantetheine-binding protein [Solirubrobacteraceae bacterium]